MVSSVEGVAVAYLQCWEKCTACKQLTMTYGSVTGSADCTHVEVLQRSVGQDDAVDVAQI
jgi:hypothetical protein